MPVTCNLTEHATVEVCSADCLEQKLHDIFARIHETGPVALMVNTGRFDIKATMIPVTRFNNTRTALECYHASIKTFETGQAMREAVMYGGID